MISFRRMRQRRADRGQGRRDHLWSKEEMERITAVRIHPSNRRNLED